MSPTRQLLSSRASRRAGVVLTPMAFGIVVIGVVAAAAAVRSCLSRHLSYLSRDGSCLSRRLSCLSRHLSFLSRHLRPSVHKYHIFWPLPKNCFFTPRLLFLLHHKPKRRYGKQHATTHTEGKKRKKPLRSLPPSACSLSWARSTSRSPVTLPPPPPLLLSCPLPLTSWGPRISLAVFVRFLFCFLLFCSLLFQEGPEALAAVESSLEASLVCLMIVTCPGLDRKLCSDEVIDCCLGLFR